MERKLFKMDKCVVYAHIRPDTKRVFYIGKGFAKTRAYARFNRNTHWQNVVNKNNRVFIVEIIFNNISHSEAIALEISTISFFGLENLTNITIGGEGTKGWIPSEETKRKISKAHIGKVVSKETRNKLSVINTGLKKGPVSDSVKSAISKKNKGSGNGMFGKKINESSRKLQREKISGELNYLSRPILNKETGIFYHTLQDAADTIGIKRGTLWAMLAGRNKNKTSFYYV